MVFFAIKLGIYLLAILGSTSFSLVVVGEDYHVILSMNFPLPTPQETMFTNTDSNQEWPAGTLDAYWSVPNNNSDSQELDLFKEIESIFEGSPDQEVQQQQQQVKQEQQEHPSSSVALEPNRTQQVEETEEKKEEPTKVAPTRPPRQSKIRARERSRQLAAQGGGQGADSPHAPAAKKPWKKPKLYEQKWFSDPARERSRRNAISARNNRERKKREKEALQGQVDLLRREAEALREERDAFAEDARRARDVLVAHGLGHMLE